MLLSLVNCSLKGVCLCMSGLVLLLCAFSSVYSLEMFIIAHSIKWRGVDDLFLSFYSTVNLMKSKCQGYFEKREQSNVVQNPGDFIFHLNGTVHDRIRQ